MSSSKPYVKGSLEIFRSDKGEEAYKATDGCFFGTNDFGKAVHHQELINFKNWYENHPLTTDSSGYVGPENLLEWMLLNYTPVIDFLEVLGADKHVG